MLRLIRKMVVMIMSSKKERDNELCINGLNCMDTVSKDKKISLHESGQYEWVFENEGDRINMNVSVVNVNKGDQSEEYQLIIDSTFVPHNIRYKEHNSNHPTLLLLLFA